MLRTTPEHQVRKQKPRSFQQAEHAGWRASPLELGCSEIDSPYEDAAASKNLGTGLLIGQGAAFLLGAVMLGYACAADSDESDDTAAVRLQPFGSAGLGVGGESDTGRLAGYNPATPTSCSLWATFREETRI